MNPKFNMLVSQTRYSMGHSWIQKSSSLGGEEPDIRGTLFSIQGEKCQKFFILNICIIFDSGLSVCEVFTFL